jgi:hypothetical protein
MKLTLKLWIKKAIEKFWIELVWMMPHELLRWCFVRVVTHATTGKFGSTELPGITAATALARWDDTEGGYRPKLTPLRAAVLVIVLIALFATVAHCQQSEFDRVHEQGLRREMQEAARIAAERTDRILAQNAKPQVADSDTPPPTAPKPIKVSAEDALRLRELQVKLLTNQNDMLITEMNAETLRKSNSAIMTQINKGIAEVFDKAKVSQKDYILDDAKWELVPKEAKKQ